MLAMAHSDSRISTARNLSPPSCRLEVALTSLPLCTALISTHASRRVPLAMPSLQATIPRQPLTASHPRQIPTASLPLLRESLLALTRLAAGMETEDT